MLMKDLQQKNTRQLRSHKDSDSAAAWTQPLEGHLN